MIKESEMGCQMTARFYAHNSFIRNCIKKILLDDKIGDGLDDLFGDRFHGDKMSF